jgi:hypothetical protein
MGARILMKFIAILALLTSKSTQIHYLTLHSPRSS